MNRNIKSKRGGQPKPRRSTRPAPRRGGNQTHAQGFMPAAIKTNVKSYTRTINRTKDSVTVTGQDLIFSPSSGETAYNATDILSALSVNPAYWGGTRIAQIAPAYQNYRPIRLVFKYVPFVSVQTQGIITLGTLWNQSVSAADLNQTLLTSPGGSQSQCYFCINTNVPLGREHLQLQQFTLNGSLNNTTNPFLFLMTNTNGLDTSKLTGWIYAEYTYHFTNPVGATLLYNRGEPIQKLNYKPDPSYKGNRTIVLYTGQPGYGPGTAIDVEVNKTGEIEYLYQGSHVEIPSESYVQEYSNGIASAARGAISVPCQLPLPGTYSIDESWTFFNTTITAEPHTVVFLVSSSFVCYVPTFGQAFEGPGFYRPNSNDAFYLDIIAKYNDQPEYNIPSLSIDRNSIRFLGANITYPDTYKNNDLQYQIDELRIMLERGKIKDKLPDLRLPSAITDVRRDRN